MIKHQTPTSGFYTPQPHTGDVRKVTRVKTANNRINKTKKVAKYILITLATLIMIGGGIAGYLLSQKTQDVRQQASEGTTTVSRTCSLTFTVPAPGCNDPCTSPNQCSGNLSCHQGHCLNPHNLTDTTNCADPVCPCISSTEATATVLDANNDRYQIELHWRHLDDSLRHYRVIRFRGDRFAETATRTAASHWIDKNSGDGFACGQTLGYKILVDDHFDTITCVGTHSCFDSRIEVSTPPCPTPTPIATCDQTECKIENLTVVPNRENPQTKLDVSWKVTGEAVATSKTNFQITYAAKKADAQHFAANSWHILKNSQITTGQTLNHLTLDQVTTEQPFTPGTAYLVDVTCKKISVSPSLYCFDSSQVASTQNDSLTPTPTGSLTPTPTPTGSLTPTPTPTGGLTPTPTPTIVYACDSPCETNDQCQTVNAEYICAAEYGNHCRLDSNRGSSSCQTAQNTYACNSPCDNSDQCRTANSNYKCSTTYGNVCRLASNEGADNCQPVNYLATATQTAPLAGCNQACESNANCAYTNYICYSTTAGNVCRLDQYPNSTSCQPPAVVSAYVPTRQQVYIPPRQVAYVQEHPSVYAPTLPAVIPTPAPRANYTPYQAPIAKTQPELPKELYQTGPADWANWLKAGLVTLSMGAALLLLL